MRLTRGRHGFPRWSFRDLLRAEPATGQVPEVDHDQTDDDRPRADEGGASGHDGTGAESVRGRRVDPGLVVDETTAEARHALPPTPASPDETALDDAPGGSAYETAETQHAADPDRAQGARPTDESGTGTSEPGPARSAQAGSDQAGPAAAEPVRSRPAWWEQLDAGRDEGGPLVRDEAWPVPSDEVPAGMSPRLAALRAEAIARRARRRTPASPSSAEPVEPAPTSGRRAPSWAERTTGLGWRDEVGSPSVRDETPLRDDPADRSWSRPPASRSRITFETDLAGNRIGPTARQVTFSTDLAGNPLGGTEPPADPPSWRRRGTAPDPQPDEPWWRRSTAPDAEPADPTDAAEPVLKGLVWRGPAIDLGWGLGTTDDRDRGEVSAAEGTDPGAGPGAVEADAAGPDAESPADAAEPERGEPQAESYADDDTETAEPDDTEPDDTEPTGAAAEVAPKAGAAEVTVEPQAAEADASDVATDAAVPEVEPDAAEPDAAASESPETQVGADLDSDLCPTADDAEPRTDEPTDRAEPSDAVEQTDAVESAEDVDPTDTAAGTEPSAPTDESTGTVGPTDEATDVAPGPDTDDAEPDVEGAEAADAEGAEPAAPEEEGFVEFSASDDEDIAAIDGVDDPEEFVRRFGQRPERPARKEVTKGWPGDPRSQRLGKNAFVGYYAPQTTFGGLRRRRRVPRKPPPVFDVSAEALDTALDDARTRLGEGLLTVGVAHLATGLPLAGDVDLAAVASVHRMLGDADEAASVAGLSRVGSYLVVNTAEQRLVIVRATDDMVGVLTVRPDVSLTHLAREVVPSFVELVGAAVRTQEATDE